MRFVLSLLTTASLCAVTSAQQPAKKCPLTLVDRYEFYCKSSGTVQDPYNLKKVNSVSLDGCVRACQSRKRYKSFQYNSLTSECQLFEKYLTQMDVAFDNYTPGGKLYDRDCFTTSCNVIEACDATKKPACRDPSQYAIGPSYPYGLSRLFREYSCAYGKTARIYNFPFKDILVDGTLPACDAISICATKNGQKGSLDIHYDIPGKMWVCRSFRDATTPYSFPGDQRATRVRYTVNNASVGAGYGFFLDDSYYIIG